MSIAQRLVNFSDGLSVDGILSAAKGGTGTTTGAGSSTPTISAIGYGGDDTATNPAGGATITLTGTNFASGAKVLINTTPVSVVTVVSATQITFAAPALAAGSYILYVVNLDGSTAIAVPGIQYSGTPAWSTAAGSLGTSYETAAVSTTVAATSDSAVTYSVVDGTLPSGVTINASGTISGTSPAVGGSTTYTFTVRATDAEKQDTDRQFSLTVNPDVVTWSSPANGATLSGAPGTAYTSSLSATSVAGQTVSYTANTLPAGLAISGSNITGTPTAAGSSSTTLTATSAVTNKSAQITINWTISIAADTYFLYNTLLLNGENTSAPFLADASTNNFSLTAFGDTKPNNFGPYTPGYYSNYFDGSGDYISIPTGSAAALGTTGTVEFWYCPITSPATARIINNGISAATCMDVYDANGQIGFSNAGYTTSAVKLNTWTHIACVINAGVLKIYFNGVSQPLAGTTTGFNLTATGDVWVGGINGYSQWTNGYVSNLRFVKGTAVYTADFTPPTSPLTAIANTSLLTCQSNRFIDNSTNAFAVTKAGDTKISGFDPFVPNSSYATYGSTYFDGSGDYLSIPASSALSFDADFTIECWVNTATISLDPYGRRLWSFGSGASFYLDAMFYDGGAITSNLCIQIPSIGVVIAGTIPVANNQWNHVALTRSGSSMKLFVNGVQSGSTYTNSSAFTSGASNGMFLGCVGAGVGGFLLGNISNFRVVKGTALYTANFTPPTQPLTAVANTSLLTLQTNQPINNQTFLDNSSSALPITRAGNVTQGAFSPYGANWSNYFDGTGDYLTATGRAEIASGEFTIEAWVFPTVFNTLNSIVNDNNWQIGQNGGYRFYIKSDGKVELAASTGVWNSYPVAYTSTGTVPLNKWTHIALTRNSSNVIRCFINGVQDATSVTYSTALNLSTAYALVTQIGGQIADGGLYDTFTGYISNLRVVNGTGGCLYTTTFTPPTQPLTAVDGTKLLTCQSADITDNSLTAGAITRNGDVSVQRFSPFATVTQTPRTYSTYFDGTGDYITTPALAANQLTGDFTVECWFNLTGLGSLSGIVGMGGTTYSNSTGVTICVDSNMKLYFKVTDTVGLVGSTTLVTTGVWHHVALVRSGSTNTMYFNGVAEATNTATPTWAATPTISIGKAWLESAYTNFNGYISNVRIVKGTAIYTSNFTPPTQPLTAVAGTYLLACQDPTVRDNSTTQFTLTTYGDTRPRQQNPLGWTASSAQDYTPATFGGSAYFDGSGDYLDVPHSSNQWIGLNQDFTIECWFYITGGSGERTLIAKGYQGSPAYAEFGIVINSSNQLLGIVSSSGGSWLATPTDTVAISNNTWNHVALVRNGTTITLYRNGVAAVTATNVGAALYNHTGTIRVGQHTSGSNFTGYISDARVVIGTALYTANFVPPVAPLQAVQNTTLLLNMDRAAISDKSGKVVAETVGDVKLSTAVKKYGTSSIYFDGTGDYLTFPSNPHYAFGTGDFTIECWVNSANVSSSQKGFLQTSATAGGLQTTYTSGITFLFGAAVSGGNAVSLSGGVISNVAGTYVGSTTAVITQDTWTHLALVRSNGTATMYVNGVSVGSATATGNCTGTNLVVGGYYSTGYLYAGYLDDLRISRYARYTANFTPPAQALLTK